MSYRLHEASPPCGGLEGLSKEQRKFTPRMWDLGAVQRAMLENQLKFIPTLKASNEMLSELSWINEDALSFFHTLRRHHYYKSEWISLPKPSSYEAVYPADIYIMGYSKALKRENEKMNPKVYFKFTLKDDSFLMLASCHPEKNLGER